MGPMAQRMLAEIREAHLSTTDQRELVAALTNHAGHHNPNAKWSDDWDFLEDLCEWAEDLPVDDLPPREADAARYFGVTTRTIGRYLTSAEVGGWDGFLRFWSVANRENVA